jgi:hypothetical protein
LQTHCRTIYGPTCGGPVIVNSVAQTSRINAYLGSNPKPQQSRHVFYMLANTFPQLLGDGLMSPKVKF